MVCRSLSTESSYNHKKKKKKKKANTNPGNKYSHSLVVALPREQASAGLCSRLGSLVGEKQSWGLMVSTVASIRPRRYTPAKCFPYHMEFRIKFRYKVTNSQIILYTLKCKIYE